MTDKPKYAISEDGKIFVCLDCGKSSRHPEDVARLFCAACGTFHQRAAEPALGYSRAGDVVTVRLMRADFEGLLMCIGGAMALNDPLGSIAPRVANAINAGRPASEWVPYEVPKSE